MITPDNMLLASEFPTFVNSVTATGAINISGTIANGVTQPFSGSITSTIVPNLFRADIYGFNTVTNTKALLNTLLVMDNNTNGYAYTSSEFVQLQISYSGQTVTITYSIFNGTGSSITLIPQTIELTLAEYQVPF